jgi:hypothetical protein
VFARFQFSLELQENELDNGVRSESEIKELKSQYKTIPTFLALFIFGFLYVLVLCWDALRRKNTIQIIGLCLANLALFVYTILQISQIHESIDTLRDKNVIKDDPNHGEIWQRSQPFLIAVPSIVGIVTAAMCGIAYQLYREFAWDILKQIGADYRMKKRFLHYQVGSSRVMRKKSHESLTYLTDLYRPPQIRFLLLPRLHDSIHRRRQQPQEL